MFLLVFPNGAFIISHDQSMLAVKEITVEIASPLESPVASSLPPFAFHFSFVVSSNLFDEDLC